MATMVVMYTLRKADNLLLGPINKTLYASFAPKEHAFRVARREADKRGFTDGSGKLVQIVIDGDNDFLSYARRYFPKATHTLDVIHAIEKLWIAGQSIYREGSAEHRRWVAQQRKRLLRGKAKAILAVLKRHLAATPKTGPGNKGRRERLSEAIIYFEKRLDLMTYDVLLSADLETATGEIEGAIKNVIGKRCDQGGMRWIRERAHAVVQLRCIELNGEWDAFVRSVHGQLHARAKATAIPQRLQTRSPPDVPESSESRKWRQRRRPRQAA